MTSCLPTIEAKDNVERHISSVIASGVSDYTELLGERLFAPQIDWGAISIAAFNLKGELIAGPDSFAQIDPKELLRKWYARKSNIIPIIAQWNFSKPTIFALIETSEALNWKLEPDALKVATIENAEFLGVTISSAQMHLGLNWACNSLNFTPLQNRIITALVCNGDLKKAAKLSNTTYASARDSLANAMKAAGVTKKSALLSKVVSLSFGILPEDTNSDDILRDIWGLSQRQAQLSLAISHGATRADAAHAVGVSEAVAKKELKSVYETLGISSGSELTALLYETSFIAALERLTGDAVNFDLDRSEPLKLIRSIDDNRMIAISDYGPSGAKPVLVLHSSSASRPAPSVLIAALHARGFRPFAIDRPGFGLTDIVRKSGSPFSLACKDIRTVCHALGFEKIDIVARGGAQVAANLILQSPELIGSVVLVAPDPSTRFSKPTKGILGAIKRAIQSNPDLTESLAKIFVSSLRGTDTKSLILKTVASSEPDVKVMQELKNVADYRRGFQMFTSGKLKGYAAEQSALATEDDLPIIAQAIGWKVLIGAHDPLHDPKEMQSYWQSKLPNAEFAILPDAGRFIVMSHAELVADLIATQ